MSRSAKRRISFSTILLVTFAVAGVSTVWAQPKAQFKPSDKPLGMPVSITEDISLDQLKAQKASVERSADLDAMDKKNMLNLLDKAIPLLKEVFQKDENWRILTERLPRSGLLNVDKQTLSKILSL